MWILNRQCRVLLKESNNVNILQLKIFWRSYIRSLSKIFIPSSSSKIIEARKKGEGGGVWGQVGEG